MIDDRSPSRASNAIRAITVEQSVRPLITGPPRRRAAEFTTRRNLDRSIATRSLGFTTSSLNLRVTQSLDSPVSTTAAILVILMRPFHERRTSLSAPGQYRWPSMFLGEQQMPDSSRSIVLKGRSMSQRAEGLGALGHFTGIYTVSWKEALLRFDDEPILACRQGEQHFGVCWKNVGFMWPFHVVDIVSRTLERPTFFFDCEYRADTFGPRFSRL